MARRSRATAASVGRYNGRLIVGAPVTPSSEHADVDRLRCARDTMLFIYSLCSLSWQREGGRAARTRTS